MWTRGTHLVPRKGAASSPQGCQGSRVWFAAEANWTWWQCWPGCAQTKLCYLNGIAALADLRISWWFGLESTLKSSRSNTPAQVVQALYNLALNTSRSGASTASPGTLCQCLTTFTVNNSFLVYNVASFSLESFPFVLSLLLSEPCQKSLSRLWYELS